MMTTVWTGISRFMRRTGWYLLGDSIIVVIAYRVALTGRFAGASPNAHYLQAWSTYIAFIVFIHLAANYWAGMYSRLWRFASAPDALIVVQAWLGATIPLMLMDLLHGSPSSLTVTTNSLKRFANYVQQEESGRSQCVIATAQRMNVHTSCGHMCKLRVAR